VNADCVIIGGGLSGLVDAVLLAETGRRIIVLEQHRVLGGYLQQFRRKDRTFDVGFHYMGSTQPGRPMRQFLEHLRVWDRLEFAPFPDDAAIEIRSGSSTFAYPVRFARFREKALETWPHECAALERYFGDIEKACALFKWFALKQGRPYDRTPETGLFAGSLAEYLDPRVTDPWLKEVLSFQTFNMGLLAHEAPWYKYALALRSNFDLTSRIVGGGGALVRALCERGRELGVEYRCTADVASLECDGRTVKAAVTSNGERFEADLFIAACPPKAIVRRIADAHLPPLFKERILAMRNSRGAFQVFLSLKAPLRSMGATCYFLHDHAEAAGNPPIHTVHATYPYAVEAGTQASSDNGPRLEAMVYMDYAHFAPWADRPVMQRGSDYARVKDEIARRIVRMLSVLVPELPELLGEVYTATPLTDEWYTKNDGGGVFGISHDVGQTGIDRPQPRVRLKNLFFTGQSITMPGICGVCINAFDTVSAIRGDDALFAAVAT
jgi:all-trans-retinol 13,14-reductase